MRNVLLGLIAGLLLGGGGAALAVDRVTPNAQNFKVCLATKELQQVVQRWVDNGVGGHPYLIYKVRVCRP